MDKQFIQNCLQNSLILFQKTLIKFRQYTYLRITAI
jgi:hypothetical protein